MCYPACALRLQHIFFNPHLCNNRFESHRQEVTANYFNFSPNHLSFVLYNDKKERTLKDEKSKRIQNTEKKG